jgi:hypothetical protein
MTVNPFAIDPRAPRIEFENDRVLTWWQCNAILPTARFICDFGQKHDKDNYYLSIGGQFLRETERSVYLWDADDVYELLVEFEVFDQLALLSDANAFGQTIVETQPLFCATEYIAASSAYSDLRRALGEKARSADKKSHRSALQLLIGKLWKAATMLRNTCGAFPHFSADVDRELGGTNWQFRHGLVLQARPLNRTPEEPYRIRRLQRSLPPGNVQTAQAQ